MWNASRFVHKYIRRNEFLENPKRLYFVDRWLLNKLQRLIINVTRHMETFRFNLAVQELQEFFWHLFCDDYIEMVKHRLNKPKKKWVRKSAVYTLNHALWNLIKLYAPITPHITEELYHRLFKEQIGLESIHLASWPKPCENLIDEDSEFLGELLRRIVWSARRFKSKRGMALSKEISHLKIVCQNKNVERLIEEIRDEIKAVCKVKRISFGKKGLKCIGFKFQGCEVNLRFRV
jgi:valyl-tRNA synthetase